MEKICYCILISVVVLWFVTATVATSPHPKRTRTFGNNTAKPKKSIPISIPKPVTVNTSLPLCTDNLHVHGKWQMITKTTKSFVCCGWDEEDYKWNTTVCGATNTDMSVWHEKIGDVGSGIYRKMGGHACHCDKRGSRTLPNAHEKYEWMPHICRLSSFNATRFCKLLGNRIFTIIGDSTLEQTASTLMNLIIAQNGKCIHQIRFGHTNHMYNEEQFRDWHQHVTTQKADIAMLGFGAHFHDLESYVHVWDRIARDITALQKNHSNVKFVFKLQNPPHIACGKYTSPISEQPYIEPNVVDNYKWHFFRAFDEMSKYRASKLGMKVLDMYPLYLRPDSHPSQRDCLHFCLPGPLDIIGSLVLTMLETREI